MSVNILELDEAQGLTSQAVREYLERKGWVVASIEQGCTMHRRDHNICWVPDRGPVDAESRRLTNDTLQTLTRIENRTPQAILREIVKRWAHFPTLRTIQAHDHNHGGRWLRRREHDGQVIIDIVSLDGGSDGLPPNLRASSRYWPIDEDGNRVPMPYEAKK